MSTQTPVLAGKVAVVTGGGRGIGKMITRGLLEAGAKVYISSRKDADLKSAVEELSPLGEGDPGRCLCVLSSRLR
ncbi:SDR family NAD(P)-dependent oxidoreductase [Streptomyces mirabilis]|uniref:SDR family NAD(P)-dependent oxidoreductase n=1 Tax=Streptomyces mirabilis TaxID=68239 RepID=UPI003698D574